MRKLISHKAIRYYFSCGRLSSFNKKNNLALLMLVSKIQRPKIFEMGKKRSTVNNNNNKKTPASRDESMTPACAFSMNQSVGAQLHNEERGRLSVSVACFNCSTAEV